MVLGKREISAMEPVLEWTKRTALYPKDMRALKWVIQQMDRVRVLKSEPSPEIGRVRKELEESPDTFLEAHQVEFTRLFVNRFGGVLASPYASYYLDHNILLGPSTNWAVSLYRQGGLAWSKMEGAETPDHLAVELEFLQFLSREVSTANKDTQDPRPEDLWHLFWEKHLNHWVPKLVARLSDHARAPLYQLLAKTLSDLYEKENDYGRSIRDDL